MTTENTKLLAIFMGFTLGHPDKNETRWKENWFGNGLRHKHLQFDTDWNWLMPVIQECVIIAAESDEWERYWKITDMIPRIDTTYEAVVEFIKWYNEQK